MDATRPPWLTKEGYVDLGRLPIDSVLQQAVGDDERQVRSSLMTLEAMYGHGRKEAGIFLLGLFVSCEDRWEKRTAIVDALKVVQTQACVDLLFQDLKRVKSTNTTRRYLTHLIKVLLTMPSELVLPGFRSLCTHASFSPKMRQKFAALLGGAGAEDDGVF